MDGSSDRRCQAGLTGVVRRGIMLYLYTGQRGSDVVRLGQPRRRRRLRLSFERAQQKTRVEVWCPILPELAAEMESWPRRPGPYLVQETARPTRGTCSGITSIKRGLVSLNWRT